MNVTTLVVAMILILVIVLATYGSYKTMHSESCCDDDRNCTCCETAHCSIRKDREL
ncbi:MAG: hypothetical protein MJZ38_02955 [archaeon]|nr:hypothetical protein [archaeon]